MAEAEILTERSSKLTERSIKGFTYRKGRDVRWDTAVPGLGLRIYPSGKKAFIISYRVRGRKRLLTLGSQGVLKLDQARRQAKRELVMVGDGGDPLEEKRKRERGKTFGDLSKMYITDHAKGPQFPERPRKKTWKADENRLARHIPKTWKSRKADDIGRWDVERLHNLIGADHPYEANRLLEILRKMFKLARVWGFIEPMADNPAEGIDKFRERKRKTWVRPEELPAIARAIDNESSIYVRAVMWLYLFTGCRKTELLVAEWRDVDWERGQLRLPDTKAGEEQTASLSPPALAILQALPRQEGNPYILPGAKEGQHLVNVDKAWRRIRKAAGVEHVRLHDLRRTVGSWLAQGGVDLNRIKDAMRHANITTTLIYAQLGETPAKAAMEEHAQRILEAAGKHRPSAVAVIGPPKA